EGINTVEEKDIIAPVSDNLFAMSEDEIEEKGIEHLPPRLQQSHTYYLLKYFLSSNSLTVVW
ncbi:MAG: type I glutamate--ammonia ligase, partial [Bacilli bacterium]|nr:type I glutamate--ammonia ligase [Bacilli bacterium]